MAPVCLQTEYGVYQAFVDVVLFERINKDGNLSVNVTSLDSVNKLVAVTSLGEIGVTACVLEAYFRNYGKLVLTSVGMDSTLTIHSNGTFLCFNKRGRLVNKSLVEGGLVTCGSNYSGSFSDSTPEQSHQNETAQQRKSLCQFREILRHSYSTFESVFNPHWYIGFNRTGHPIQGPNVRSRKWKCAMFQKREFRPAPPQPFDKVSQAEWAKYLAANS
ncbi:hypothetical protein HPB47_021359 [Ixodes persulcatus]|uniref:Uncharacterized protein n=1 Tax=Ixodes persulcatus TaxID=34615 RepID=A0AC60QFZ3_IXOPE|nr:hypothetical protein HPB47_021359 [Ixodes persulcatus]